MVDELRRSTHVVPYIAIIKYFDHIIINNNKINKNNMTFFYFNLFLAEIKNHQKMMMI